MYCPDAATLKNMQTFDIWGEGFAGNVRPRVTFISAVGCSGEASSSVNVSVQKANTRDVAGKEITNLEDKASL